MAYKAGKGRKIKRSNSLYGNRRNAKMKNIIALVVTLVVAGILVFLGYSIGEPVVNYFKNRSQSISDEAPWTPSTDIEGQSGDNSASETVGTTKPDTATAKGWSAYELDSEDLTSIELLQEAVSEAKLNGYNAVVVPLKVRGGEVYYASAAELAVKNENTIKSTLTLGEINAEIRAAGMMSAAKISTLNDNLAPKQKKDAGYLFENSSSSWYDNRVDNGGKPWLSPFSDSAKQYLSQIEAEVKSAGFDTVIVSDVVFPPFRKNDLNYIGAIVKDDNRYLALLDVVSIFGDTAPTTMTEVSAAGIFSGAEEVFKPESLATDAIVVNIDLSEFGNTLSYGGKEVIISDMSAYDKTKAILEGVSYYSKEADIVPKITAETLGTGDSREVVRAFVDMGYEMYIIS